MRSHRRFKFKGVSASTCRWSCELLRLSSWGLFPVEGLFIAGSPIVLLTTTTPGVVSGDTSVIVAATSVWATVSVRISHIWTSSPSVISSMYIVNSPVRSILLIEIIIWVTIIVVTRIIRSVRQIVRTIWPAVKISVTAWLVVIIIDFVVVILVWTWPKELSSVIVVIVPINKIRAVISTTVVAISLVCWIIVPVFPCCLLYTSRCV